MFLFPLSMMLNTSSMYLFQSLTGMGSSEPNARVLKILHVNVSNYWRARGTYGSTVKLFKELVLEGKDTVLQD